MSLILRVDVDKPYGRSTIFRKVASKLSEDYWFPSSDSLGYLSHLDYFLTFCNSKHLSCFIYFRNCTAPNKRIKELLKEGNHKIGFHAENTRTLESFSKELNHFTDLLKPLEVGSFTKHGSGTLKLGKNHFPPYEPEKYSEWSKSNKINFFFGNGISNSFSNALALNGFYPNMFWIEREYRHEDFFDLEKIIEAAKNNDVVILIHPCNFHASKIVFDDLDTLIDLAKEGNINWKIF